MKVLMLSTDENILREGTEVRNRMLDYSHLFDELHIIILNQESGIRNEAVGNLFLYPTNSSNKILALRDAYKIAVFILGKRKTENGKCVLSAQDPFEVGLVGYLLKKKFKVPLQLQVHTDFLSPYFWRESLKNKIRVLIAKWILPKAEGIRVVSQRIKSSIESSLRGFAKQSLEIASSSQTPPRNDRITVLPIFVDTEKIKSSPIRTDLHKKYLQFDFIILMASRLTCEKNIGMAIEAMGEVVKNYLKAGLVIVGSGPENLRLKLQTTNYPARHRKSSLRGVAGGKLQTSVIFEDWSDDLASYYKTADLFLLTSNYEGYGRTAIEAAAAGCPVVMTDVGLAGEVIVDEKSGLVVPVGDKNALVKAIMNMIQNKEKRERLAQGAGEAISKLMSKGEYLKKYKELLERI